jgi:glutathione S-transferase
MALTFYAGSGSPFAWRVWLSLEHKSLSYELKMLSFSAGDLKKPEFAALNPRKRVPVIVDDGLVLYESSAIVRYLEDRYPDQGRPLFPGDVRERAIVNRLIAEIDTYFIGAAERLVSEVLFKPNAAERNMEAVREAIDELGSELRYLENEMRGDFLAGELSAADYTLYPHLALGERMEKRNPGLKLLGALGPRLSAWKSRIERLPFYGTTYPPHWR